MRDLQIEEWLKDHGYNYKFVADFPLAEIDLVEARDNPVRLDRQINEDIALGYGIQMEAHGSTSKFPAVVLLEVVSRPLKRVLGGTHRLIGAGSAHFTTHDAYIVREPDSARIDFVHGLLNSIEGQGESFAGRLARIAFLRTKHPSLKLTELAREAGISRSTASEYMAADKAEQRADRLGIGIFFKSSKMTMKTKAAFEGLQSDAVFIAAANLVQAHPDLRAGSGVSLLKELRAIGSEVRAKAIIFDRDRELTKAEENRKAKKIRTTSTKATRFLSRFHGVVKAWPGSVERLYLAGLETIQAIRRELKTTEQSIDIAMEVREELRRLIEEHEKATEWEKKKGPGASDSDPISPPH